MNLVRSFLTRTSRSRPVEQNQTTAFAAEKDLLSHAHSPGVAQPDTVLITACLDDDKAAWDLLVAKYANLVYWIARGRTQTRNEADHVFENVFANLARSLPQLRQEASLALWLTIIARREAESFRNGRKNRAAPKGSLTEASNMLGDKERRQLLREYVLCAMWQLPVFSREFLLACMENPAPGADVLATRFHIPVQKVGMMRWRCMRELETVLTTMGISILDELKRG